MAKAVGTLFSVLGPAAYSKAPYASFAGKVEAVPPPPTPEPTPVPTAGVGGGGWPDLWPAGGRIRWKAREDIEAQLRALYQAATAGGELSETAEDAIAEAVAPYAAAKAADVPAPSQIDWGAIVEQGRQAVTRIETVLRLALARKALARRTKDDEDEDDDVTTILLAL